MSTEPKSADGDGPRLKALLRRELAAVPVEHWGYFFPIHVAVWRFIEETRPGFLGQLSAGFKGEPYFRGRGADWFVGTLGNTEDYISLLEEIMYPLTRRLAPLLAGHDSFREDELPEISSDLTQRLATVVLREVDHAT